MPLAEMIITNAKVLTMDEGRPRAEAVALAGGRILAVGARAEMEALAGPGCRVVDAGGRTLLPGFVESHLHLVLGGNELSQLQLGGVEGFDDLARAFRAYAEENPDLPLLMAQGAAYEILDHPVTRHDLDLILDDRPIAMMSPDH
ncbi:amidohydrolase family protein, partial [Tabrizicola sp.]|uniref:amidohydrolase family protein n=1 Tax=Tabrizicola sp. TaxID=2005166 RepID=UPI002FDCDA57